MPEPTDPLRFPSTFPPTSRWDKFFVGVRWIGPDLSFFRVLNEQQAARSLDLMSIWRGGLRQELAERIARVLQDGLRWKTAVFLPDDSFQVVCRGPTFDWGDDLSLADAIADLQKHYKVTVPDSFWERGEEANFGEIVDGLLSIVERRARSSVVPSA